ncbi:hypothetical protein LX69_03095 [Breznakibacter xylanolyticus]|uniref:Uncharacterized protein n=1 Tax=Breznakibacter xylanolyticus TaxID=990 RepID=A0A2W7MVW1_9BACT|nr:hypothetical protein [Breznakibacter xylanolyticus]PZX11683.1 hypothetical protein LX69_03095 [Breznakibacter xylanolyticus]
MANRKKYIYLCEKCNSEIIPLKGIIKCDNCGYVTMINEYDWANHPSKSSLNKSNFISRFIEKITNRIELLSQSKKITLAVLCLLFFLFLTIEIYDVLHWFLVFFGPIISMYFIILISPKKYSFFKSPFYYIITAVILIATYEFSYNYRRDRLFKENGKTIEAQIKDFTSFSLKHSTYHYVHYKYQLNDWSYFGIEEVCSEDYFQLRQNQIILIDYVDKRPWISRINVRSLESNTE